MKMSIRLATETDWEGVIAIYNQAVATRNSTADLEPVTVASRLEWLRHHTPARYPLYVEAVDGSIRGWCSLSPYRPGRMALRFTAEISYYVHEDYQRQGVATSLLRHALREAPRVALKSLIAILLDHNTPSIRLLEKFGFERWGHLPKIADFSGKESRPSLYGPTGLKWDGQ